LLASAAAVLPAVVVTAAAAAAADEDDDDVVVGVAKLIRSAETAGVGTVCRTLLAATAGRDAVLPEFTAVRDRVPADDGDVTSANVSDARLVEMSPPAGNVALDRGPITHHKHTGCSTGQRTYHTPQTYRM